LLASGYLAYRSVFPHWTEMLKAEVNGSESVLDLGCGPCSPLQLCEGIKTKVGVDAYEPYIRESAQKGIHDSYALADLRRILVTLKSETVLLSEVLEHMTKAESTALLEKAERIATRKVVITTPNGYVEQHTYDDNELQTHKCGWTPGELRKRGYRVSGINGCRWLHDGHKGLIKYRPVFLWSRVDDAIGLLSKVFPELAFQLFAVKNVNGKN
jgi:hypothetical protein